LIRKSHFCERPTTLNKKKETSGFLNLSDPTACKPLQLSFSGKNLDAKRDTRRQMPASQQPPPYGGGSPQLMVGNAYDGGSPLASLGSRPGSPKLAAAQPYGGGGSPGLPSLPPPYSSLPPPPYGGPSPQFQAAPVQPITISTKQYNSAPVPLYQPIAMAQVCFLKLMDCFEAPNIPSDFFLG
jgi:hypothetical protein